MYVQENNKVIKVFDSLFSTQDAPKSTVESLNSICQLYHFDRIRSFIRIGGSDEFTLLDEVNYNEAPKPNKKDSGIDLSKSFFITDGADVHEMMDYLITNFFIHTYHFDEYEAKLQTIGYIPTEGRKVIEACIRCVKCSDTGMLGYFVLERFEGTDLLSDVEIKEVHNLCEIINRHIEIFEVKKQLLEEEFAKGIDSLTGLPTIKNFKEKLPDLMALKQNYALIYLDIDKFKYINEMWSSETGDDILMKTAEVLIQVFKKDSICCRMNDDKFVAFFPYDNEDALKDSLNTLNNEFLSMQKKYFQDVKITMIAGIYLVADDININLMIDKANIARKSAKGTFENTYIFYNQNLENLSERERQLENRMVYALENKEFIPFLQPKFNLDTMEICGAEALARWKTKERMIPPSEFIPVFEKNGFITKLDFLIYESSLAFMEESINRGTTPLPISMNVSREHMKDEAFLDKFTDLLTKYRIPGNLVELEITESIFMADKEQLNEFIRKIRSKGIAVSIDDFGTAYSSLNLLKDIVVDTIKLDKSFIDNIRLDETLDIQERDKIIIKNIITMLNELNFKTIFEGIELQEQVEFLKNIGCTKGQGFYFERPMPLEDFRKKFL